MRKNSDDGFTLVEVLVAFAILAMTLTLAFRSFGSGARGVNAADRQALAVAIAQSRLAAAGVETPLEEGTVTGTHEGGLHWRLTARRLPDYPDFADATGLDAFRVTVAVRRANQSGGGDIVNLSAIRLSRRR